MEWITELKDFMIGNLFGNGRMFGTAGLIFLFVLLMWRRKKLKRLSPPEITMKRKDCKRIAMLYGLKPRWW